MSGYLDRSEGMGVSEGTPGHGNLRPVELKRVPSGLFQFLGLDPVGGDAVRCSRTEQVGRAAGFGRSTFFPVLPACTTDDPKGGTRLQNLIQQVQGWDASHIQGRAGVQTQNETQLSEIRDQFLNYLQERGESNFGSLDEAWSSFQRQYLNTSQ